MSGPVLIMAGGTGGHVYPGLAVAAELKRRGREVVWLGTRSGLEAEVVPQHAIAIDFINVGGLRGKGVVRWLLAPLVIARAVVQAIAVLRRHRPSSVLGMGGFAAGPGGVAAWLLRVPLLIHEQNAVAGLTNRLLAPLACRVLEGFAGTFPAHGKVVSVGNPVREAIAALPSAPSRPAGEPLHLLVLGGSLGAQALNEVVAPALERIELGRRPQVLHQSGRSKEVVTREAYQRAGVEARVEPFLERIDEAYGWADLVVCRAGALTLAEVAAAGLPAILVPYPHAVDDHQRHNAEWLVARGAAVLLLQRELDAARLAALIEELVQAERLQQMAHKAKAASRTDAASKVANHCLEVAR